MQSAARSRDLRTRVASLAMRHFACLAAECPCADPGSTAAATADGDGLAAWRRQVLPALRLMTKAEVASVVGGLMYATFTDGFCSFE